MEFVATPAAPDGTPHTFTLVEENQSGGYVEAEGLEKITWDWGPNPDDESIHIHFAELGFTRGQKWWASDQVYTLDVAGSGTYSAAAASATTTSDNGDDKTAKEEALAQLEAQKLAAFEAKVRGR